jgi:hypothetical protein
MTKNRIRRAIEPVRVGNSTTTYLKVRKSQRLPPSNFGLWHFCDMAAMNLHPVLCLAGTDVAGHDLIPSMSLRHAEPKLNAAQHRPRRALAHVTKCDTRRGKRQETGGDSGKSKSCKFNKVSRKGLNLHRLRPASQAYDEGSIPFTRSSIFRHFPRSSIDFSVHSCLWLRIVRAASSATATGERAARGVP